jgi:hypothetical protein
MALKSRGFGEGSAGLAEDSEKQDKQYTAFSALACPV